ncbi:MAG: glucose-6-phosphate isomerase [Bacillota bacterium]|nr:glucose-6-phosphate isomerase [Bacillota bacterium]
MDSGIKLDYSLAKDFFTEDELLQMQQNTKAAHEKLHSFTGAGQEYTGWLQWPKNYDKEELERVKACAERIKDTAEVLIVIGIGGSYLGARSALEVLNHSFYNNLAKDHRKTPAIYFAGNNISATYLTHLLEVVKDKELVINVVSKSGTTLEPALAFRIFRELLEKKYGKEGAKERIIATTDKAKGALKQLADEEGYETFVVPDDIGGRYSVLTSVGLLPIAVGGINIDEILKGANRAMELYSDHNLTTNPCYQYAVIRNILYQKGKTTELLISYEPSFQHFAEWWKQLFGESEGKDGKGIFPASVSFTTDLHSLGQYIQEGQRNLFATTLWLEEPVVNLVVPRLEEDMDGLNYLAGKELNEINDKACQGTMLAHTSGGVPNLKISVPKLTPCYYGQLVYFFEKACAISGYLLGVNPFDQPGVEAYKKAMFKLLGKS